MSISTALPSKTKHTPTHKVAEAKSNDSKRRFTSYIFHEIRVPLNTALLALQNLENSGVFSTLTPSTRGGGGTEGNTELEDQHIEWQALVSSFSMMQKVLNDVLDFSKMDAGKFEVVFEPFYFHRSLKNNVLHSVESMAHSKGLDLVVDFDPRIDQVVLQASKDAARLKGESSDSITEGVTVGGE